MRGLHLVALGVLATSMGPTHAEEIPVAPKPRPANYDEDKVPPYSLPDPLVSRAGAPVSDPETWNRVRRPEIMRLFQEEMFGVAPPRPEGLSFRVVSVDDAALGGAAIRKNIELKIARAENAPRFPVTLYLPKTVRPAPVFVGLHLFDTSAEVPRLGTSLVDPGAAKFVLPKERLFEEVVGRGYGVASLDAKEIAPDAADHFCEGVIDFYAPEGVKKRAPAEWGAIGAWAWALSRALDYLETDADVDAGRVIAIGHSRMGKTALWAGAQDERFAMVVSNNSGCGGAALSKRIFGETVALINARFPHWFCESFRKYNDREVDLPFDQHMLLALIAPRPVYVGSAAKDAWADPRGEFLACVAADPVYRLLGVEGLVAKELPPLNESVGGKLGYHLRAGPHALTDFDWLRYVDFADRWLSRGRINPPGGVQ